MVKSSRSISIMKMSFDRKSNQFDDDLCQEQPFLYNKMTLWMDSKGLVAIKTWENTIWWVLVTFAVSDTTFIRHDNPFQEKSATLNIQCMHTLHTHTPNGTNKHDLCLLKLASKSNKQKINEKHKNHNLEGSMEEYVTYRKMKTE